jgi:hypothetical protein
MFCAGYAVPSSGGATSHRISLGGRNAMWVQPSSRRLRKLVQTIGFLKQVCEIIRPGKTLMYRSHHVVQLLLDSGDTDDKIPPEFKKIRVHLLCPVRQNRLHQRTIKKPGVFRHLAI